MNHSDFAYFNVKESFSLVTFHKQKVISYIGESCEILGQVAEKVNTERFEKRDFVEDNSSNMHVNFVL